MANNNKTQIKELFFNSLFDVACKSVSFTDRVKAILLSMDEDMQTRALAYIIKPSLYDVYISPKSNINGKECEFISYNFLRDEIKYKYTSKKVRYFANESDAEYFHKFGYAPSKSTYESTPINGCTVMGEYTYIFDSYTTLEQWEECSIDDIDDDE